MSNPKEIEKLKELEKEELKILEKIIIIELETLEKKQKK